MAEFSPALEFVLPHEGGYSNNPNDPGGETMYGITAKVARAYGYTGPMRDLPLSVASEIYASEYWPGLEYVNDQAVASKILDMRVNFGVGGATRLVQIAVNNLVEPATAVDGGWGPDTLESVNAAPPADLVAELANVAAAHYEAIAANDPKKAGFLRGWLNRAKDLPPMALAAVAGGGGLVLLLLIGGAIWITQKGGRA